MTRETESGQLLSMFACVLKVFVAFFIVIVGIGMLVVVVAVVVVVVVVVVAFPLIFTFTLHFFAPSRTTMGGRGNGT